MRESDHHGHIPSTCNGIDPLICLFREFTHQVGFFSLYHPPLPNYAWIWWLSIGFGAVQFSINPNLYPVLRLCLRFEDGDISRTMGTYQDKSVNLSSWTDATKKLAWYLTTSIETEKDGLGFHGYTVLRIADDFGSICGTLLILRWVFFCASYFVGFCS